MIVIVSQNSSKNHEMLINYSGVSAGWVQWVHLHPSISGKGCIAPLLKKNCQMFSKNIGKFDPLKLHTFKDQKSEVLIILPSLIHMKNVLHHSFENIGSSHDTFRYVILDTSLVTKITLGLVFIPRWHFNCRKKACWMVFSSIFNFQRNRNRSKYLWFCFFTEIYWQILLLSQSESRCKTTYRHVRAAFFDDKKTLWSQ